jgi:hypothetical protein
MRRSWGQVRPGARRPRSSITKSTRQPASTRPFGVNWGVRR